MDGTSIADLPSNDRPTKNNVVLETREMVREDSRSAHLALPAAWHTCDMPTQDAFMYELARAMSTAKIRGSGIQLL